MTRLAITLATWFGCGYVPWGPGTAGSLAAIGIAALLHVSAGSGKGTLILLICLLIGPGIWAATKTARFLNSKDPGLVVVDEVLGQWITVLGATVLNWRSFLAALLLFRIFDIWKPWPVRSFEKLPEGWGIVADDLMAGVYGALILYIGGRFRLY